MHLHSTHVYKTTRSRTDRPPTMPPTETTKTECDSVKGYFHSTTLMLSFRIGFDTDRQNNERQDVRLLAFDDPAPVFVRRLAIVAMATPLFATAVVDKPPPLVALPAMLAAASVVAQPELSDFSRCGAVSGSSDDWLRPPGNWSIATASSSRGANEVAMGTTRAVNGDNRAFGEDIGRSTVGPRNDGTASASDWLRWHVDDDDFFIVGGRLAPHTSRLIVAHGDREVTTAACFLGTVSVTMETGFGRLSVRQALGCWRSRPSDGGTPGPTVSAPSPSANSAVGDWLTAYSWSTPSTSCSGTCRENGGAVRMMWGIGCGVVDFGVVTTSSGAAATDDKQNAVNSLITREDSNDGKTNNDYNTHKHQQCV